MGAVINLDPAQAQGTKRLDRNDATVDDPSAMIAILEAGARARAVADAFAANGLAAILLDAAGRVLHVGLLAESLFGDSLRLEAQHLVGRDGFANRAIETALNGVLGGAESRSIDGPVVVVREDGGLVMTAVAYRETSPVQLLRAVVLIGIDETLLRERLHALDV